MEIEFSQHSLDQLKIRTSIKKFMVTNEIKNPDESDQSYKGREVYRKRVGRNTLEVVTVKEDNKIIIITEYFLE